MSGLFLQRNAIAEALQPPDQTVRRDVRAASVEIVRPELRVRLMALHQVIADHEDRMRDGQHRPFLASTGRPARILRRQLRGRGAGGRVGGLDQGRCERSVPFTGLARTAFARTFIIPRSHTGPHRQMLSGGKTAPIDSDLGDDDLGGGARHPGDGLPQSHSFFKRAAVLLDALIRSDRASAQGGRLDPAARSR